MKAGASIAAFLHGRRGVYTTMRSVGIKSIFSLPEHVRRLALVPQALDPQGRHDSFDEEATSRVLVPKLREAMARFTAECGASAGEMKISAAMRLRDESTDAATATLEDMEVLVAVEQLYDLRLTAVSVELALHGSRDNPTIKHGQWIEQRKALEEKMRPDCNEVVLVDGQGLVYEGLSSNVMALDSSGTLWTAPSETVLTGTVMQLVLSVCEASQIRVRRACPTVELLCGSSVLISSTSRLTLPVERLYLLDGTAVTLSFSPLARELVGKVKEQIDQRCTQIL